MYFLKAEDFHLPMILIWLSVYPTEAAQVAAPIRNECDLILRWDKPDHAKEFDNTALNFEVWIGMEPGSEKNEPWEVPLSDKYFSVKITGQYLVQFAGIDTITGGPEWCLKRSKVMVTKSLKTCTWAKDMCNLPYSHKSMKHENEHTPIHSRLV